jgi:hypothetical protein
MSFSYSARNLRASLTPPAAAAAVVQQRAIMPGTGRTEERARTGTELVTALIGAAVSGLAGGGNG